ncbi:hypothetical protein DPMN_186512 [Dreissena polymorpha]|uniref:Uncharacterized protein n=1 Tax=Dreissena polymorpha TaxID=45954 RepID=A0A9D4DNT7_DREPO|nr:hypothetical protein DPMN_186512 [Dreissena polymorpha]
MATGQIGPSGQVVQCPVMWDSERGQEPVLILNQTEMETIVSVNQPNIQCAQMNPAT